MPEHRLATTAPERLDALRPVLREIVDVLPGLLTDLYGPEEERPDWLIVLERQLLPTIDRDEPLILMALCGGGSTGKSTLFNALAGKQLSKTGFRAGMTRRILLCGHPEVTGDERVLTHLEARLGQRPQPFENAEDLTTLGPPLLASSENLRKDLLLIDTPDFDTGEGDLMPNREQAQPALQTAELLLYTFTNAVYNNTANAAFMHRMMGKVGSREAVLIYRVSRTLQDDDAREHFAKVAQSLYPGDEANGAMKGLRRLLQRDEPEQSNTHFPEQVLACYRIDESDDVALGKTAPSLQPVYGAEGMDKFLDTLDTDALKSRVFLSELHEVEDGALLATNVALKTAKQADLYEQLLRRAIGLAAIRGLRSFPRQEAIQFIFRTWQQTSPGYVRFLRASGHAIAGPVTLALKAGRAIGRGFLGQPGESPQDRQDPTEMLQRDLIAAASQLRTALLGASEVLMVRDLTKQERRSQEDILGKLEQFRKEYGGGEFDLPRLEQSETSGTVNVLVETPPLLQPGIDAITAQSWEFCLEKLREASADMTGFTPEIESRVREDVIAFRKEMSAAGKMREALFSSMTVLPPIAAVAYVLTTGDPVTGGAIAVKLNAALGVNDLWAIVAMPVASGLNEVDRRQLSGLLQPVLQEWFDVRYQQVVSLLEDLIAKPVLERLDTIPSHEDERFRRLERAIDALATMTDDAIETSTMEVRR